ncbi:hypothetical protein EFM07_11680 [Lactococcus lactis]|nr:hypothetical protein [Lactococcus lactis]MCT1194627.1 hypothetical protein [Lactococcus lactis]MCT1228025.1 hypothetical protein [Lactococcus lactis]
MKQIELAYNLQKNQHHLFSPKLGLLYLQLLVPVAYFGIDKIYYLQKKLLQFLRREMMTRFYSIIHQLGA